MKFFLTILVFFLTLVDVIPTQASIPNSNPLNEQQKPQKIIVYGSDSCHYCLDTKDYLKKYKFAIEYFDMSLNRCPSYEDAKKWREKSLAELPANTTVTELEEDTLENIEEKRKESGTSGVVVELLE